MSTLMLALDRLARNGVIGGPDYDLAKLRRHAWEWDRVVKASHAVNCWYQAGCTFNIYVKDGVVLREEQAGNYPAQNNARVPDFNPGGCQKGVCYSQRMYDPTRIKYPMKRIGQRGEGKWKRISWDDALAEVADAVIDTLMRDGPAAIVQGAGTQAQLVLSEATGSDALFIALGAPLPNITQDNGDEHQGAANTFGKVIAGDSADNWFYADIILIWGGNPAYTNISNFHFIAEARYHGSKVITIAPDYSPSAIHADRWMPVKIGSDAALALSMCQVILKERLFKEDFVREQTDLPLLVVERTGKFLREKDLKRGGREDVFYLYDTVSRRIVEAPRKTLALGNLVPALDGSFEVMTLHGPVVVRPVMDIFRKHLDERYSPDQASRMTGVPAAQIESFAREIAAAQGVVNIPTANWGKFYHGDLIERAIILVFVLCGHMGRKGAGYNAFPMLGIDTAVGGLEKRGDQILLSAAGADPRFSRWRDDGYTDEMILYEYMHDAFAQGSIIPTSLMYYLHGGLLDLSKEHNSWDPYLKRPVGDYVEEAFAKGWQFVTPAGGKEPRVLFSWGGNFLKRARGTNQLLRHFLPKLRMLVHIDWRWNTTGLYSDIVLPVCSWYERNSTLLAAYPVRPFAHAINQATDPLYESKSEWELFVLLARKIEARAAERGISGYPDMNGTERRFAGLEDKVTFGGLYPADDEEGIARDYFVNASNLEPMDWDEFKARGHARYTGIGTGMRSIGNACDIVPGEPVVPFTWHVEGKQPYPTLTRRIQVYLDHDLFQELGEHLPVHKDPPRAGGDYPLQITGGHARWSIHSSWVDDALMLQLQRGEPSILMSPHDADPRGIRDGDSVEVINDVASYRTRAVVSPAVRPGQLIVYHAWENYQFQDWQHFKTVMATPLNPVELAGDYFHIRPITMNNYPGFSDRGTRVEVRRTAA